MGSSTSKTPRPSTSSSQVSSSIKCNTSKLPRPSTLSSQVSSSIKCNTSKIPRPSTLSSQVSSSIKCNTSKLPRPSTSSRQVSSSIKCNTSKTPRPSTSSSQVSSSIKCNTSKIPRPSTLSSQVSSSIKCNTSKIPRPSTSSSQVNSWMESNISKIPRPSTSSSQVNSYMESNTSKIPRPSTSSYEASYELEQPVAIGKNGLPLPRPTRTKKLDLIDDYDFDVFDECATEKILLFRDITALNIAIRYNLFYYSFHFKGFSAKKSNETFSYAPNDLLLGTFWQLVEYLVITPDGDLLEEMLRMRTLYRWVTSFDIYNIESELIPPQDSPLEYFLKIQCGQGTHAELFYILCELADLPCVVIQGITKNGSYKIGGKLDKEEMASQWNAVFIEGQWRLIDVFWSIYCAEGNDEPVYILIDGNACITRFCEGEEKQLRINEFYFLTDPDAFIWTHLPNDKEWQLLRHPLDEEEFESRLYVREMFTKMQMGIKNKKLIPCSLKSEGKPIGLEFTLPEEQSHNFKFMFTLFQSRTELDTDKRVDIFLERFVGFEHTNKCLRFVLRFPFTGKFQMDIFGCDLEASDSFELICTYVIECSATMENCMPFPDCPAIGWGPNPHAEKHGFITITPNDSCIYTNNGEAEVRVKVVSNHHICHSLKSLEHDDAALTRYSISRFEHDEFIVNIRVPKSGEYALKIYADIYENDKLKEDTNILNFMVMCKDDPVDVSPYPDIIGNHLGQKEGAKFLRIYPLSHPSGLIKGWDGKARLEFEVKHVGIKMFCEVFSARRNASSRMSFDKREEDGLCLFNIDMPVKGEYSINVFASKDEKPDLIYDVYSGLINSSGYASKRVKFDDDDTIDEMPTESIHTSDKNVKISLPHNCKFLFTHIFRKRCERS
ncbi:hypothetical protein KUTeg_017187 [Tegillarca granosa]|uniref:KY-like immunoglobulin-like domain-containing protein n=1 Tax=Tegillarca granosa TaxID=220873 RepID=A0ABQ9EST0_TEGGR|nr:hypothetical protein KUTeg_017187 [Tegillarca granosa]